ncbi:MAG: M17 family peptidase N-terminal domain-containing protein, partial [Pyrinomonadaceae bacterium]
MKVSGSSKSPDKIDVQALAVAVFKDEKPNAGLLKNLDQAVGGLIAEVIRAEEFAAKEGETAYFHVTGKELKARRVLLIGCGDRDTYKAAKINQMAGSASRFLRSKNVKSIGILPRAEGDAEKIAQTTIAGATMGLFEPDKYRTKDKEERQIDSMIVIAEGDDEKALSR